MAISSGDILNASTTFSNYIGKDVVDLVYKLADANDEREISTLRILSMMNETYDEATTDTDPSWEDYIMTLPRVGSAEPKTTLKTWSNLVAWRSRNDSHICDRFYVKANAGKTLRLASFYEDATSKVTAGKDLEYQLSELKKTMGKDPVICKIDEFNKMNPIQKEKKLKYLNDRVKGLNTKVKTAVRVAHHLADIRTLLPDVKVTVSKNEADDLSPSATPFELEYTKQRSMWDVMTTGSFLRLDPVEAHKTLADHDGNQWEALKATLGRERDADESVVIKDDMTADVIEKAFFKQAQWLTNAANRTQLNKLKNDKDTGVTTRHSIANLVHWLSRIMTRQEMQQAWDEIAQEEADNDTRVQAGGSQS